MAFHFVVSNKMFGPIISDNSQFIVGCIYLRVHHNHEINQYMAGSPPTHEFVECVKKEPLTLKSIITDNIYEKISLSSWDYYEINRQLNRDVLTHIQKSIGTFGGKKRYKRTIKNKSKKNSKSRKYSHGLTNKSRKL